MLKKKKAKIKVGSTPRFFRRSKTKIKVKTLEGYASFVVPKTMVDGNYIFLRVIAEGATGVTCIVQDSDKGRQTVCVPRKNTQLFEGE